MKTLFKRANVLTMKTDEIHYATDLLVEDGRILRVAKDIPAGDAAEIDCKGLFLMPALFDAHVHLNTSEMCELFIANGITSVRHLSGGRRQQQYDMQVREGSRVGPYIYSSSPIYDGADAPERMPGNVYLDGVAQAEQAVYDSIEAGYRWVKTYPSLTPEQLKRLMETANACGIKVCGHMSYHVDAKTLRDWGYYCCEHSSSLPRHPADIEYLAKSGMWFCPTQVVCETLPDYVWNGKQLTDLEQYEYVPEPIKRYWEERNVQISEGYKKRGLRPDINVVIARGRTFMQHSNMQHSKHYMAGSDTMYPGMIAGYSLHDELYKLVTLYGLTPFEALSAATAHPALYMGLEDEKGMLKAGMDADLLLLEKNPLADVRNVRHIRAVMQGGHLYARTALDAMLERVKSMTENELEYLTPLE